MKCPLCGETDGVGITEDYGPMGETTYAHDDCGTTWIIEDGEKVIVGE